MELLNKFDPLLKQESVDFDFQNDDPEKLFYDLKTFASENRGIGLSACQLGIMKRVFVVGDPDNIDEAIPFFNPRIVDTFGDNVYYEEGCLTFPGLWVKVKRPQGVRIRFAKIDGDIETMKFDGLTSRIIQHEYDHLQGILFLKRANLYHLEQAKKHQKKIKRKFRKKKITR
jgi:peptide deformylase